MKFNKYRLEKKHRDVLDNLSDEDKIKVSIKKYDPSVIDKIFIYYDLKDNPLHKKLALKKYQRNPYKALCYARNVIKGRWKEAEPIILMDAKSSYIYCSHLDFRWKEAEKKIIKDPLLAYLYAQFVIKNRWRNAEPFIEKDANAAYMYAKNILKKRWKKAENIIKKDPHWAYYYATDVIKDNWKEAERYIKKDKIWWNAYKFFLNNKELF